LEKVIKQTNLHLNVCNLEGKDILKKQLSRAQSREIVKLFFDHPSKGAKPNHKDKLGNSALTLAAEFGKNDMLEFLILHAKPDDLINLWIGR